VTCPTGNNAFTLAEILMVVVIISVCGIVVAPRLFGVGSAWNLEAEAQKMRSHLREAQQRAISTQSPQRVVFTSGDNEYEFYDEYPPGTFNFLEKKELAGQGVFISLTTFTSAAADTVDFDVFGAPTEGGTVLLQDTRGNTIQVIVEQITGKALVI